MVLMTLDEQLTAAIGAHGLWKGKLRTAVDSGTYELRADVIRDDRRCNFGKWLHGTSLDSPTRASTHYHTCVELHRNFHEAAANVVSLVEAGDKSNASRALGADGQFARISGDLTAAMMAWKGSLSHNIP